MRDKDKRMRSISNRASQPFEPVPASNPQTSKASKGAGIADGIGMTKHALPAMASTTKKSLGFGMNQNSRGLLPESPAFTGEGSVPPAPARRARRGTRK